MYGTNGRVLALGHLPHLRQHQYSGEVKPRSRAAGVLEEQAGLTSYYQSPAGGGGKVSGINRAGTRPCRREIWRGSIGPEPTA